MSGGGDKTEAPTQRRKEKAAEDGNILKSKDFATALVVMAGVAWLIFAGPSLIAACKAVMTASFQFDRTDVEDFSPWRPLQQAGWKLLPSLITLFAVSVIATIISSAGLGSLTWNNKLIAFKGERINPASGLKRILGPQGWIELGKSLLKVVLLAVIGGYMLWKSSRTTLGLSSSSLGEAVGALGGTFTGIMIAMAAGLVAIALFDVPIQIIQLLSKLKMTKQEVRDEHKETEGSPEAKGHQRSVQRAMAKGGVRKAVAEAHQPDALRGGTALRSWARPGACGRRQGPRRDCARDPRSGGRGARADPGISDARPRHLLHHAREPGGPRRSVRRDRHRARLRLQPERRGGRHRAAAGRGARKRAVRRTRHQDFGENPLTFARRRPLILMKRVE
jgi:flagellar biosynthesis protein FlhB